MPACDMFSMRPAPEQRYLKAIAADRPLLIACRNTAWSASRATAAVTAVSGLGGRVAVLAVVSDGWPDRAPRPPGSAFWNRGSARSSGCRSCPDSG